MCARFTLRRILEALRLGVDYKGDFPFEEFSETKIVPKFNIKPSDSPPIVRLNGEGIRVAKPVLWGFVPHWTKGKPKFAPVNAMSETAATNPMFKQAMERRRCLIPMDGFYEPKGPKTMKNRPWYFFQMRSAAPFCVGGIWERWQNSPTDPPRDTFALLTSAPNQLVGQYHERMPLILQPSDYRRWLDRDIKADGIADLLVPYQADNLEVWRVGDGAKKPDNDGPQLIEKIPE